MQIWEQVAIGRIGVASSLLKQNWQSLIYSIVHGCTVSMVYIIITRSLHTPRQVSCNSMYLILHMLTQISRRGLLGEVSLVYADPHVHLEALI